MCSYDARFTISEFNNRPAFFAQHVKPHSKLAIWSIAYPFNVNGFGEEAGFERVPSKKFISTRDCTSKETIEFTGGYSGPTGCEPPQLCNVHVANDGEDGVCFVVHPGPRPVVAVGKEIEPAGNQSEVHVRIDNDPDGIAVDLDVFPHCDEEIHIKPGGFYEGSLKIPDGKIISFQIRGLRAGNTNESKQTGGTDQADIIFP